MKEGGDNKGILNKKERISMTFDFFFFLIAFLDTKLLGDSNIFPELTVNKLETYVLKF